MKRVIALSTVALAFAAAPAFAQAVPPPLPAMSEQQSSALAQQLGAYRSETDARVARGEITPDEAGRLVQWREWQIARALSGRSGPRALSGPGAPMVYDAHPDVPPDYADVPPDYYEPEAAPYYGPVYRYAPPYYWGPRPYAYWGPSVCAGGFGRHFGGRFCF